MEWVGTFIYKHRQLSKWTGKYTHTQTLTNIHAYICTDSNTDKYMSIYTYNTHKHTQPEENKPTLKKHRDKYTQKRQIYM